MTAPVVDCSITGAWVLDDEVSAVADRARALVRQTGGAAPVHWWAEVYNTLLMAERRGRIASVGVKDALAKLNSVNIMVEQVFPDGEAVLQCARRYGLTFYDALYLDLAQREDAPLATLDRKLADAAKAAGVELVA